MSTPPKNRPQSAQKRLTCTSLYPRSLLVYLAFDFSGVSVKTHHSPGAAADFRETSDSIWKLPLLILISAMTRLQMKEITIFIRRFRLPQRQTHLFVVQPFPSVNEEEFEVALQWSHPRVVSQINISIHMLQT
jgi:hypothetical protein